MKFSFCPYDASFRSPTHCTVPMQENRIRIFLDAPLPSEDAFFLHLWREDGFRLSLPMKAADCMLSASFYLPNEGLYFYRFSHKTCFGESSLGLNDSASALISDGDNGQISCVPADFVTPAWCLGAVMYQIFPDRFHQAGTVDLSDKMTPYTLITSPHTPPRRGMDENGHWNNDFYGGNLMGIREKLPYLASLGVNLIYLNPIFKALSNHRYDTADYKKIDPMLGSEQDLIDLCASAHALGIRIILDGVFSHVGADSIYFDREKRFGNGAAAKEDSPYREWFTFTRYPSEYDCWWGVSSLPCVREMTPSFLAYLIDDEDSVIRHWIRCGIDGFRLDVADELPDAFLAHLRAVLKEEKSDALLIGEVWEDASNKISYGVRRQYFTAGELDSVMNYPLRGLILDLILRRISPSEFACRVMTLYDHLPVQVIPCLMNSLSTHDTPRIATLLSELPDKDREGARLASLVLLFTLPGMPCLYYGDETGMEGDGDPDNRGYFRWDRIRASDTSLISALSALRRQYPQLGGAEIRFCCEEAKGCLCFLRRCDEQVLRVRILLDGDVADMVSDPDMDGVLLSGARDRNRASAFDYEILEDKNGNY